MTQNRTIVDVHVLQSVPPSCINRDDTGSPKSAVYGGVRRARVSSQAWKRATRKAFDTVLDREDLGVRTKRVVELVADEITQIEPETGEHAQALAESVLKAAGLTIKKARNSERLVADYLVLMSRRQVEALARHAVSAHKSAGGDLAAATKAIDKREAKRLFDEKHSIDLGLFGRMVADDSDLTVDAACQVAHALSVHQVDTEFDYFTAVDELKSQAEQDDEVADAGAGMIGTVEFSSATLYRYATIDVDALMDNLGDQEMTRRGLEAFVGAFVESMPTGKANTFANHTRPDCVVVTVRDDRPVSLVGAFEEPVQVGGRGGYTSAAVTSLVKHSQGLDGAYGDHPLCTWSVGVGEHADALSPLGESVTLSTLSSKIGEFVGPRIRVEQ